MSNDAQLLFFKASSESIYRIQIFLEPIHETFEETLSLLAEFTNYTASFSQLSVTSFFISYHLFLCEKGKVSNIFLYFTTRLDGEQKSCISCFWELACLIEELPQAKLPTQLEAIIQKLTSLANQHLKAQLQVIQHFPQDLELKRLLLDLLIINWPICCSALQE